RSRIFLRTAPSGRRHGQVSRPTGTPTGRRSPPNARRSGAASRTPATLTARRRCLPRTPERSDMNKIKHWSIALGSTAIVVLALATAPSAFAAPSGYFDHTFTFTDDTGIVCGGGANSFDVLNSATVHRYGPSFVDENGNFVKDVNYIDTDGTFSNSVT